MSRCMVPLLFLALGCPSDAALRSPKAAKLHLAADHLNASTNPLQLSLEADHASNAVPLYMERLRFWGSWPSLSTTRKRSVAGAPFACLFLCAGVNFLARGRRLRAATGAGMQFHIAMALAAWTEMVALVLEVLGVPGPELVSWSHASRVAASSLVLATISSAFAGVHAPNAGAAWVSGAMAGLLHLAAWTQATAASAVQESKQRWGLYGSAVATGCVAMAAAAACMHGMERKPEHYLPLDMVKLCNIIYALLWLPLGSRATGSMGVAVAALTDFADLLFIVGAGHLLLKQTRLLEKALVQEERVPVPGLTSGAGLEG